LREFDDDTKKMLVEVFPLFWQGGITSLFPLVFQNPTISSSFTAAVIKGLARMCQKNAGKFHAFIQTVGAIKMLVPLWDHSMSPLDRELRADQQPRVFLNHHVFQFGLLITYGRRKYPKPRVNPEDLHGHRILPAVRSPESSSPGFIPDYKEYSMWVRDVLLPYYSFAVGEVTQKGRI
jgi:hypothetical protein